MRMKPRERPSRDPVDAVRLRGVPVVGPGSAGGAIPGTRPDFAVLRSDEKPRRTAKEALTAVYGGEG